MHVEYVTVRVAYSTQVASARDLHEKRSRPFSACHDACASSSYSSYAMENAWGISCYRNIYSVIFDVYETVKNRRGRGAKHRMRKKRPMCTNIFDKHCHWKNADVKWEKMSPEKNCCLVRKIARENCTLFEGILIDGVKKFIDWQWIGRICRCVRILNVT